MYFSVCYFGSVILLTELAGFLKDLLEMLEKKQLSEVPH